MLFQPAILNEEGYSLSVNDINDFPLHWHNDIEILYCISGGFGISVRGKSYDVFAGDAVLCGSCEPQMVEGRAGGAVAVIIRLGSLFCGARIYREIIKRRLDMPILSGSEYIKEQLERLLENQADSRELELIKLRYGIGGGTPLTQKEAAKKLGISRSYVSRIEKKMIERLRELMEGAEG